MPIAVTGSDRHRPPDDVPGQVRRLARRRPARQDLAVLPRRRPRGAPGRRRRQHRVRPGLPRPATRSSSARSARTSPTTVPGWSGTASTATRCTSQRRTPHGPIRVYDRLLARPDRVVLRRRDERGPGDRARADRRPRRRARPRRGRRRTTPRRCSGTPTSAATAATRSPPTPPSSSPWSDGEMIRRAHRRRHLLLSNEYEAALIEQKTGWTADEILDRVGTGRHHARLGRRPRSTARARTPSTCGVARSTAGRADRRRRRVPRRFPGRGRLGPRPRARRPGRLPARGATSSRPSAPRSTTSPGRRSSAGRRGVRRRRRGRRRAHAEPASRRRSPSHERAVRRPGGCGRCGQVLE